MYNFKNTPNYGHKSIMPKTPLKKLDFYFKHCHIKLTSIVQFQLNLERKSIFHCQVMDISNQYVIPKIFTQLQLH